MAQPPTPAGPPWPEPTSTSNQPRSFGEHGAYQPFTPQQTYVFAGRAPDGNGYTFRVLAGYGGPKITQGWAKVNVINRPLRLGYTIPDGYDPWQMGLPVQFEARTDQATGHPAISANLELDIQKLEWMAGRGRLYGHAQGHTDVGPATGMPPLVNVASLNGAGNVTNLIPANLHLVDWVITNIDYDNTAPIMSAGMSGGVIRDRTGDRVRQAATVTLLQYIASPGADNSPASRQRARGTAKGFKAFKATAALDTIHKIVRYATAGKASEADIQTVVAFNRDRLHVRSAAQKLRRGTVVRIPTSVLISR
ncbi:MAG: hypothetical protein ACRDSS_03730 [Actinocrinis sp.]